MGVDLERLRKMKDFLKQEHEEILKKIRDQSDYVFTMRTA